MLSYMPSSLLTSFSLSAFLLGIAPVAVAQAVDGKEVESQSHRPHIYITKGKERVKDVAGSVHIITKDTIETFQRNDINEVLRSVPGVNIQDEDGLGLRPNIGMRGGRVDRSSDITLMEDGVLIAPAPYAAPSAYLFPYMEHISGMEVRKGSSAIKYGPRTTNGALNLLSTPIPDDFSGQVKAGYGNFNQQRAGVELGDSSEHFGYVIDTNYARHDGFKNIDNSTLSTGVQIEDLMGKLRFNTSKDRDVYQEIEFKTVQNNQTGNETYLGLTMDDFRADPNRRYKASELDRFEGDQNMLQARHYIEPTKDTSLTTTLYTHKFKRDWYRLTNVTNGTSNRSITDVLNNPSANADHLAILKGQATGPANALTIGAQNREMLSYGLQSEGSLDYDALGAKNELTVGVRLHRDEEDRFQRNDRYQIQGGQLVRTARGTDGNGGNMINSAEAIAGFVQQEMDWGRFTLVPGARYEQVTLTRKDYGSSDPARSGASQNIYQGDVSAITPGLGTTFDLTDQWTLLAGVHEGFSPPGVPSSTAQAQNLEEEKSINYEAGVRYHNGFLTGEAIAFFTNYENLLGRDTFSSGGSGVIDVFNGGEVETRGLEVSGGYDFAALTGQSDYRFPTTLSYTYTDAVFQSSFASSFAEWGNVRAGDHLPYIPKHQAALTTGIETDQWLVNVTGRYNGGMRTIAGRGPLTEENSTDANLVFDAAAEYEFYPKTRFFVAANNLFDELYVASARPSGVRPGEPLSVFSGVKYDF